MNVSGFPKFPAALHAKLTCAQHKWVTGPCVQSHWWTITRRSAALGKNGLVASLLSSAAPGCRTLLPNLTWLLSVPSVGRAAATLRHFQNLHRNAEATSGVFQLLQPIDAEVVTTVDGLL